MTQSEEDLCDFSACPSVLGALPLCKAMRPKLIFSAVAMLACVASLRAQTSDDTIRVDTRLVSVPVIVSDRDGRYVPHLQQSDFRVFQDGTEQPIAFFGATEEPITVGFSSTPATVLGPFSTISRTQRGHSSSSLRSKTEPWS